jgi:sugar/nucleoside kinase (ribokinase family)
MPNRRPPRTPTAGGLDLLVVGALTVDRFSDGTAAPGGSVLHAIRAAAQRGASVAAVTAAGTEPEAREGLRELAELGLLDVQQAPATLLFHHEVRDGVRHLSLEGGVRLRPDPWHLRRLRPRSLLLAPVAGELDAAALETIDEAIEAPVRVAALQGWLRRRLPPGDLAPLVPGEIPHEVMARLRNCDVVVLSHEDLGLTDPDPHAAAVARLRPLLPGPGALLTWGGAGYVRVEPMAPEAVAVQRRFAYGGVPTVGAGDGFAAIVALELGRGARLTAAARTADAAVARSIGARPGAIRIPRDR